MTLNDHERRNGVILRYFTEFGQLPGALRKSSRSLFHLLMSSCFILASLVCVQKKTNVVRRKIFKIVATRAVIFGSNMHQIACRLGLRPDPTGGAYSAPPDPLAGFKGCLLYTSDAADE